MSEAKQTDLKQQKTAAQSLRESILTGKEKRSIIAATAGINLLGLAVPIALLQVYDRILPNAAVETLTMLLIGVGIALTIDAGLRYARARVLNWCGIRLEHSLGMAAAEAALRRSQSEAAQVHRDIADVQDLSALRDGFAMGGSRRLNSPSSSYLSGRLRSSHRRLPLCR